MEDLFRAERDRVLRICIAILGNRDDAEEAMQEAFLRVAQHEDLIRENPPAYLAVVARRVCWELRRGAPRMLPIEAAGDALVPDPVDRTDLRHTLAGVWRRLPAIDRRLILGSFSGYSYDEIAVSTGLSAKSVSVGLHRARARARALAERLASLLQPPLLGTPAQRLAGRLTRQLHAVHGRQADTSVLVRTTLVAGLMLTLAPPQVAPQRWTIVPGATVRSSPGVSRSSSTAPTSRSSRPFRPSAHAPLGKPSVGPAGGSRSTVAAGRPGWFEASDVQPSPNYSTDHTLVALGSAPNPNQPSYGLAYELARSTDEGHSWETSAPTGLEGFTLLLPPAGYPSRFYSFDGAVGSLRETQDGGRTFLPAASATEVATFPLGMALPRAFAMAPRGWGGDVLEAYFGLTSYAGLGTPRSLTRFPLGSMAAGPPVQVDTPTGSAALQPLVNPTAPSLPLQILRCTSTCATESTLPSSCANSSIALLSVAPLLLSPTYSTDGTAIAYSRQGGYQCRAMAWVTTDHAAGFHPITLPGSFGWADDMDIVSHAGSLRLLAWVLNDAELDAPYYSDDLGRTWHAGRLDRQRRQSNNYVLSAVLPDRVVAALDWVDDGGTGTYYLCTLDQGATWGTCPAAG